MNEEKLAAANSMNKNMFPYDDRLISASIENGHIDFTAENGGQYRIILKNLKIINKEKAESANGDIEKIIRRSLSSADNYGNRCDTLLNKMFALAKDSTQASACNPVSYDLNEVAYRMKFF